MSELSGNSSSMVPCVRGWILKMPSSMSPWMPRSRDSFDLNGRGNCMNGKCSLLVSNVLHEYWPSWWSLLSGFSMAEASAWRPIWTTSQTKLDAGVRRYSIYTWQWLFFHVLRLVYQLGENYPRPLKYTYSFGVPLGHLKENYHLTRGQNDPGGSLGERSL